MALDYATGLVVAGVFHKSGKSETGRLESRAGFKGLCRKGMELILVLVGACLDRYTGNSFVRDAVVMAFIANEALSLLENAVLMGLPVPKVLTRVLEVMQKKADREDGEVDSHDVS
jgi:toxin secretion/phage lysis holin